MAGRPKEIEQVKFYRIKRDGNTYLINAKIGRLTEKNIKNISTMQLTQFADEVYDGDGRLLKHRYVVRCKCVETGVDESLTNVSLQPMS